MLFLFFFPKQLLDSLWANKETNVFSDLLFCMVLIFLASVWSWPCLLNKHPICYCDLWEHTWQTVDCRYLPFSPLSSLLSPCPMPGFSGGGIGGGVGGPASAPPRPFRPSRYVPVSAATFFLVGSTTLFFCFTWVRQYTIKECILTRTVLKSFI